MKNDATINMSVSRGARLFFSFEGEGKTLEGIRRDVTFFRRALQFAMLPHAGTHLLKPKRCSVKKEIIIKLSHPVGILSVTTAC